MKCTLFSIVLLISPLVYGQHGAKRIGQIEFYGYGDLNLDKVRSALPLHEGDAFPTSDDKYVQTIEQVKKEIQRVTGHPPTDVETVCCNAQGD